MFGRRVATFTTVKPLDAPEKSSLLSRFLAASATIGIFGCGYYFGNQFLFPNEPPPPQEEPEVTNAAYFDIDINKKRAGRVVLGLYGTRQPKTVSNFKTLCTIDETKPSYLNCKFHRIIPDFMIQGGDFTTGDGTGGYAPEYLPSGKFRDEDLSLRHFGKGTLSMANAGPDTNGSQFFITTAPTPWLDGKHVVFGRVLQGMDVIEAINKVGTPSGKPLCSVSIADCGLLDPRNLEHSEKRGMSEEQLKERLEDLLQIEKDLKLKVDALQPKLYANVMKQLQDEKKRVTKALEDI